MRRWTRAAATLIAVLAATVVRADEPTDAEQKVAPTAFNAEDPEPKLKAWGVGEGKSYWVPAADIVGFDVLLNLFDRNFIEPKEHYRATWDSFERNLSRDWVFDTDGFDVNQFGHPYQGSMYHGFARSAGQSYWVASAYTFAGSALWEVAGETTPPSINDQLTTGIAGSFLGEPLFRMASLLLESTEGRPSRTTEWAAAAVSPAAGFNRWAFGNRFDGVWRSNDPAVHTRANLGANINSKMRSDVNANPDPMAPPTPQSYESGEPVLDFTMTYGLPGKPGYTYRRPFDYFSLQLTATTGSVLENLMTRGMLAGETYGDGEHYRGIWGLYGSYDYIAPQIFRVSNTALNLGTTGQWWVSRSNALQVEALAGAGYGSGGVTEGREKERDYHYGLTPQASLGLRYIIGDLAVLEVSGREYHITNRGSDAEPGSENLFRGDASLTIRVFDLHGLTLRWVMSDRQARYDTDPDTHQRVTAISLGYTYIGHKWFGAVDWRPRPETRTEEIIDRPEPLK